MEPTPQPRRPGLQDVARLAGCSYQTVSRVVNNKGAVSETTRQRVMAAITELGYRRNGAAVALKTARAGAIGVVTDSSWRYGPMGALHGVETAAREAGKHVMLSVHDRHSFGSLQSALDTFRDAYVDGLVIIAPFAREAELALASIESTGWAGGLPIVVLAADLAPLPHVVVVSEDQYEGSLRAVEHLISLGHKNIAHVAGNQEWLEGQVRLKGWRDALQAHHLPVPEIITGDWSGESGYQAGRHIADLRPRPTAVFVASDLMALGVMRALRERRLRIPQDISVIGFDDHEFASQFNPPLTTVRQDFVQIGRQCLLGLQDPERDSLRTISPDLIIRESTAPPPPSGSHNDDQARDPSTDTTGATIPTSASR
ncbi:LacI family DNA-binding transcriptional regulator [Nigerium massiliense]|uniref:LacI family DNA-binding transcriptional regulator n=1 Tax=Nigerium massiliense TaxID=1522317 RepID=UPI000693C593|nr:LacI family DNA-binding transcriptional regulator [Nigerium massiliense]